MIAALARRLRRGTDDSERGEGLVMVLMFSLLVLGLVVISTTTAAANLIPARQTQDGDVALAAAQGGIDDFIAKVNVGCKAAGACTWIAGNPSGTGTIGGAPFTWAVKNPLTYPTDGFVRLRVVGTSAPTGSTQRSKTLIADIQGAPSLGDYLYYTKYETEGSSAIDALYSPRSIRFDADTSSWGYTPTATAPAKDSTVAWAGTKAYTGTYPNSSAICNAEWYNGANGSLGRYAQRAAAGISSPADAGVDFRETGSVNGTLVRHGDTCEVGFSSGSVLNGKAYSADAFLLGTGTLGGAGPTFNDTIQTGWKTTSTPAAGAKVYRTAPLLPESAPSQNSHVPTSTNAGPVLPTWDGTAPTPAAALTCTYTGPTRVQVNGTNLIITSPGTPVNAASACYRSAGGTLTAAGVYQATVPIATTTIYATGAATPTPLMAPDASTARSASNSLFYASDASASAPTLVGSATAAWDDPTWLATWTDPGTSITTNSKARFAGEVRSWDGTAPSFQSVFANALKTGPTTPTVAAPGDALRTAMTAALTTAFNGKDAKTQTGRTTGADVPVDCANVLGVPVCTNFTRTYTYTARDYTSDVATATPTTAAPVSVDPGAGPNTTSLTKTTSKTGDPIMEDSVVATRTATKTSTTLTATVTRRTYTATCTEKYVLIGLILSTPACPPATPTANSTVPAWTRDAAAATPQFTVTGSSTASRLFTSSLSASAFPLAGDRTVYDKTGGDIYLDGSLDTSAARSLSIAAQGDIIVTGNLTQTDGATVAANGTTPAAYTSKGALALIAHGNVDVYHPVTCTDTTAASLAATTAGYCPNDLTGLYTGGFSGAFGNHPSRQYVSVLKDTDNDGVGDRTWVQRIDAAIYALGKTSGSAAESDGSFQVMNATRAAPLGTLTVNGGVYQLHRGITGIEWETKTGSVSRETSGYVLNYVHDAGLSTKTFAWRPSTLADPNAAGRIWNLQGYSEVTNGG